MKDFIEWKDFTFQYDVQSEPTLKGINLSIPKGEKVLILGPSGSGKSTLGHCLNGIIPNTHKGQYSGIFTINHKNAFDLSIYDKSHLVSTVLQDPDGQFIGLTVAEDIAFALENDVVAQEEMASIVEMWAKRLEIAPLLSKRPQDLSGGQKQRVSLAGVLVDDSPILLFDEPLANLDPQSGQDIMALVDRIHQEQDATTIIIEHRLEDVLYEQVDRVVLFSDGKIIYNGEPDQLLKTNFLSEYGIREPLYISALKNLGYDFEKQNTMTSIDDFDFSELLIPKMRALDLDKHTDKLLSVQHLSVSYDLENNTLDDVSFDLYKGQRLAIVGKNGAGKSTLAKALCQFIPNNTTLIYNNEDVSQDSIKERAERIGYVLQNPNQMISQAMVFDEVALGLRLRGFSDNDIESRVYDILKVCGLYQFRNWPISALSFGQKKRVTIASILILNPEVIILDEPTAGQDMKHYTEMMSFLDKLSCDGHSIVMITHDMQLMLEYTDRAIVIDNGLIAADDHPINILSNTELLKKTHLKKTSLFALADRLGISPQKLTQWYIDNQGGKNG